MDLLQLVIAVSCFVVGLGALSQGQIHIADPHVARTVHGDFPGELGYACLLGSYGLARGPLGIAGRGPIEVAVVIVILVIGYAASAF